jgi:hypothetical protein
MQVQKSLKVVQGTLQEQMESVRQMAEAEAAASVLADELLRVDMQANVEMTADGAKNAKVVCPWSVYPYGV